MCRTHARPLDAPYDDVATRMFASGDRGMTEDMAGYVALSVVIPTFNAGSLLAEALDSVLTQPHRVRPLLGESGVVDGENAGAHGHGRPQLRPHPLGVHGESGMRCCRA